VSETDIRRFESLIGYIANGFRLLMVANGAALLASLSALRDYALVPSLKGIGLVIVLFIVGFVAALLGYLGMLGERMLVGQMIMTRKKVESPFLLKMMITLGATVSISAFVGALVLIAMKVLWL
jgi:hypothetical protein